MQSFVQPPYYAGLKKCTIRLLCCSYIGCCIIRSQVWQLVNLQKHLLLLSHTSHNTPRTSHNTHHTSHITQHPSHITQHHHTSHHTHHHPSHNTPHTSHNTPLLTHHTTPISHHTRPVITPHTTPLTHLTHHTTPLPSHITQHPSHITPPSHSHITRYTVNQNRLECITDPYPDAEESRSYSRLQSSVINDGQSYISTQGNDAFTYHWSYTPQVRHGDNESMLTVTLTSVLSLV